MKITLELTDEQYKALCFILWRAPDKFRHDAESWERLAQEKNEDGTPKHKYAAGNADFCTEKALRSQELYEMIRGYDFEKAD